MIRLWLLATTGIKDAWLRTALTMLSVMFAFLLYAVANGVLAGFDDLLLAFKDTRLRVVNRANFSQTLPTAHADRIRRIEGVDRVSGGLAFPAYFQDPSQSFGGAAVNLTEYVEVLPEIELSDTAIRAVEENRIGASIGVDLAERFGWQLGDRVPVTSTYLTNEDGNKNWVIEIMAIHDVSQGSNPMFAGEMYINYDYASEYSATEKGTAHMFVVTLTDGNLAADVANLIDAEFANSSYETSTFNEREFLLNRMRQIGDVRAFVSYIMGAVFFALLFIISNTIARSVRQRKRTFGVLKAIGFNQQTLMFAVVCQSALITIGGALMGMFIASFLLPLLFPGAPIKLELGFGVWLSGTAIASGLALLISIWPMYNLYRVSVTQALAQPQ